MTQAQLLTLQSRDMDLEEFILIHPVVGCIVLILTQVLVDFFSVMIDRDPETTNYSERRENDQVRFYAQM